jgi:hypothetical protein
MLNIRSGGTRSHGMKTMDCLYSARLTILWHACPKWHPESFPLHAAVTDIPYFISFARPACLYCEEYYIHMYIYIYIYIYVYISDTVQTVYELQLLPNNTASETFLHNSERCEVLTGYLSLGRRTGGEWGNT